LVRPPILRPDPGLAASPPVRYRYLLAFTFVVRRELTTSHVKRRCATAPRPRPGRPDRGRAVLPDRPDPRPKRRLPRPAPTPGQRRWSGIQPAHDGKCTQLRGARWGRRSVDRLHRCALQQAPPHGRRAAAGGFRCSADPAFKLGLPWVVIPIGASTDALSAAERCVRATRNRSSCHRRPPPSDREAPSRV
jgi:hypothetical protein